jgi:hypothetical protein
MPPTCAEEHVEGLPPGTRGGALLNYTSRDASTIVIRLTRDRNEHVEDCASRTN